MAVLVKGLKNGPLENLRRGESIGL